MILARAWGCTPGELRNCTLAELDQMTELLLEQAERSRRG